MDRRALRHLSRELRQRATFAEREAWELLRGRRCLGLKFRRQIAFRGFILDFFCRELALNIELDGASHDPLAQRTRDRERDVLLGACGLRIIRIRNEDVSRDHVERLLKGVPPLRVCGEGDRG